MAPKKQDKGIKVIIAALPRSGTLSSATALQILGYNPYHSLFEEKDHDVQEVWDRMIRCFYGADPFVSEARGEKFEPWTTDDWNREFGDRWDSMTELPSMLAVPLWEAYPDAKVVVIRADKKRWLSSMADLYFPSYRAFLYNTLYQRFIIPFAGGVHKQTSQGLMFGAFTRVHPPSLRIQDGLSDAYDRYFDEIERKIPAENRLEFQHKEGWEPLCRFLGKPVPREPYPYANERATLAARKAKMYNIYWNNFLLRLSKYAVPALAVAGWWGYANYGHLLDGQVEALKSMISSS